LERGAAAELSWWGGTDAEAGQSQRHGYIVIAPEYIDEKLQAYDYAAKSHYITLKAIRDARKRFHVNSDKIFLSGHGMGGDAAFDIGMSHPDEFAGVIPISALAQHYCKWYWENAKDLAWYLVSGELCRNSLIDPDHSAVLGRMLRYGHEFDVIYSEYIGRGYEHYYEEIHHLFDWMDRHERKKLVKKVEATILRPVDNRFYWIKAEDLPANVLQAVVITSAKQRTPVKPMTLEASILDGSTDYTAISITSGAKRHILELSPDLIDYNKRLKIRYRSNQKFNDFPEPSIETMLDDFRERADRQKLVWTQIVIE
jgi:pimeloyl-ACP methyl ester carboxylesterase